jgi:purine-cytosine permease-like protein
VSSGAHFGVRGRVLTNLITIAVGLGFFAIAVWTGATAMMVAANRLFGTPMGTGALAVAMPVVAVAVVVAAVYGHDWLLRTYKVTAVIGAVVLACLLVVRSDGFDPGYAGGGYVLGEFWPTWLLAASVAVSLTLSYATFQGDYSRYLPAGTSDRAAMLHSGLGLFAASAVAMLVGAYATTTFTDPSVPWIQSLTDGVPAWFVVVVIMFGFVGSFPQGALCIYAAGLAANGIFWRRSRATTTAAVSVLAIALLYLGAVAFDAVDSMSAFVSLLLVIVAPWVAIMIVGFTEHGGRYDRADLNSCSGLPRGRYWYTAGFNPRAFAAYLPAVAIGLLAASGPLYTGPLADLAGGIDLSYVGAFTVGAAIFLLTRSQPAAQPSSASSVRGGL